MKKIVIVFMVMLSIMVMSCAARHDPELGDENLDIEVSANTSFTDTIFIPATRAASTTPPTTIDTSYTAERIRKAILTDAVPDLDGGKVEIPEHTMKLDGEALKITVKDIKSNGLDASATVGLNMTLLKSTLKDIINNEWLDSSQKNKFLVDISTVKRDTDNKILTITFKPFARADNQIAPDLANKEYTIEITLEGDDIWQKEAPLSSTDLIIDANINKIDAAIKDKFKKAEAPAAAGMFDDKIITATFNSKDKSEKIRPVRDSDNINVLSIDIKIAAIPAATRSTVIEKADIDKFILAIIDGLNASRETDDKFTIEEDKRTSTPTDNKILTIYLKPKAKDNFTLPATANNKVYKVQLKLTGYTWAPKDPIDPIDPISLFPALVTEGAANGAKLEMMQDVVTDAYKMRYETYTFISEGYVKIGAVNVVAIIENSLVNENATFGAIKTEKEVSAANNTHGEYKVIATARPNYTLPDSANNSVEYTVILRVKDCILCSAGVYAPNYCE